MANRDIHYEAAFEDYLRAKGWPFVVVDEAKKSVFAGASIKSFDFLVYSSSGENLLVDVKGRKFPDLGGSRRQGASTKAWENWITRDDVDGLRQWEKVFGPDFAGTLVFAYWLQGRPERSPFNDVHIFKKKSYAFVAVKLEDYVTAARPRSEKWQTIAVPSKPFSKLAVDIAELL